MLYRQKFSFQNLILRCYSMEEYLSLKSLSSPLIKSNNTISLRKLTHDERFDETFCCEFCCCGCSCSLVPIVSCPVALLLQLLELLLLSAGVISLTACGVCGECCWELLLLLLLPLWCRGILSKSKNCDNLLKRLQMTGGRKLGRRKFIFVYPVCNLIWTIISF